MRSCRLLAFAFLFSVTTLALGLDQVQVTRNVNLRTGPSTDNKAIVTLSKPETLDLLENTPTNDYFHVRTEEGQEGWVYSKNVRVIPAAQAQATENLTENAFVMNAPVSKIPEDWEKGTIKGSTFHGKEGDCPPEGSDFDPDMYKMKNRIDVPASFHDVKWKAIDDLPYLEEAPTHRKDWSEDELSEIEPFENVPVRVVGYLVAVKPQNKGNGEGTNCNFHLMGDTDFHLAVVEEAGQGEETSVVVEFTPRFLAKHPKWTKKNLSDWLDAEEPVRVSGWLAYDPDHKNHIGTYRSTLWEIHPITKFEVFKDGKFVDLDAL